MDSQNIPRQSRRAQLDKCHLTLGAARDELQALAILFEHLDDSPYSADALKGTSATLVRISRSIARAIKFVDEAY